MKTQNISWKNYIKILAHLGALITVLAWGSSFVSTKVLMETGGFTPVEMYTYRFTAAYIILLCFTFRKMMCNNWRDEVTLAVSGMCAGSLYFVTENYALTLTTTGNVSLLSSVSPIFTAILMALVFKQTIKPGVIVGSIVAFGGVGCIIFSHGFSLEIKPAGDLLALTSALCWAVYSIMVRRVIPYYNTFFITRKLFFYGVITSLPLLFAQHEPYHIAQLFSAAHPEYMLNFAFLVIMCSLLAYIIWNEAMKALGPVATNNYLYLQPLVTMILGYMIMGEEIMPLGYLGCVLIVGGLILSDKMKDTIRFNRK